MKRILYTLFVVLGMSQLVFGQLTGIKTIPGDYATIDAAVTALNGAGVGAGGVTFNVAAGYTETITTRLNVTATGTLADPIVFQKSGAGLNPVITAFVGTATPASAAPDGIWSIQGGDYITIDGIDLVDPNAANPATMEYGYGLFKNSVSDGAQNVTIMNCVITLNRVNNALGTAPMADGSVGILVINSVPTAATTALVPTVAAGTNSGNKFYTNTIQNCNTGIALSGYAAATPFTLGDTGNDVGGTASGTGNIVLNFGGGGTTSPAVGIRANNQWGVNISYNNINNNNGSGVNHAAILRGIYGQAGTSANATINNNTVSVKGAGTTTALAGIENAIGSTAAANTVTINNNVIQNCTNATSTTGVFNGIINSATPAILNINGNSVLNNTISGTGTCLMIETGSPVTGTLNSNSITNITRTSLTGTLHCLKTTSPTNLTVDGNIVDGISYTTAASTGTVSGFYGLSSSVNVTLTNNIVRNLSVTAAGTVYGLREYGVAGIKTIQNNQVYNLTTGGGGTIYGIYETVGTTNDISGNLVHSLNSTGGTAGGTYGVYVSGGTTNNIYKNNIYDLSNASAGPAVYGIYLTGGTTNYVYNNFISDLRTPAANAAIPLVGIYASGGTTDNIYYNTVYLNASSSGALFGSAAFYASTTPTIDLRNNVFVNVSTFAGATGFTCAYRRTGISLTTYAATSNNNDFYAGTPGPNNLIFYDATNSDQTLSAYKARVAPRDASSASENPPFVNIASTPYDLRVQTTIPTQLESGGSTIGTPAITVDYYNTARYPNPGYPNNMASPATAPDMGANEFAGLFLDAAPPLIAYTPLGHTASTAPRTLTTTITDGTGVPTAGIGLPVLYWRINAGAYAPVTAVSLGGGQYSFTFGGGVVTNDVVSYYICAQDTYSPPNITSSPSTGASGYTANPPACSTPPTTPNSYNIGSICGVFGVGAGQTYPTLTAAVNDFNAKEMTCPVVFLLTDALYSASETFPIVINRNSGASLANTLTIKPATGVTPTISGVLASSALIKVYNDYTVIDGANVAGGTTRDLTLTNTSVTSPSVILFGSLGTTTLTGCVMMNTQVVNGINTSTPVIVSDGITAGNPGFFSNITLQNNAVTKCYMAMYINGGTNPQGGFNVTIKGNQLDASGANAIAFCGIYMQGVNGSLVTGNTIGNFDPSGAQDDRGIWIASGSINAVVEKNRISNLGYTGTSGYGAYGVAVSSSYLNCNNTVANNSISNMFGDGWNYTTVPGDNPIGIYLFSTQSNLNVVYNSINLYGNTINQTTGAAMGICLATGTSGVSIADNVIVNNEGLLSATGYGTIGINATDGVSQFAAGGLNYNDYFINPSGTGGKAFGALAGVAYTTLGTWQAATTQDVNSVNIDPVFVSSSDLHPTAIALNNLGTYLPAFPADLTGALRTNPPDMGAFEFGLDPVVVTTAATSILSATATLNGTINANTATVSSFFDYGLTTAYGTSLAGTPASVTGSVVTPISIGISGLVPLTTYHYRARGVTGSGLIVYGPDMTFTTTSPPPTVVTLAATGITTTGATLNGTVNANNGSTTVTFEYGLTAAYGTTVPGIPGTVTGNIATGVSASISSLLPNTLYHFRVVGTNAGGTTYGNDLTFTTAAAPPTVVTDPASNITTTGGQMNGTVTANYASTTVTFEWGLTAAYGNIDAATPGTVTGGTPTAVLATLSGLLTNTTYHYRCVGVNAGGTTYGNDMTFLTGCPPVGPAGPITGPASVCTNSAGNAYSVAAIVNATGYVWTVPAGASVSTGGGTNSITVTFGSTSGNVSVYGTGPCGNGAPTDYPVTVNPLPVPTISGPATACAGSVGNVYTTQAGMTGYSWTISAGGTIASGQGTNSVTVTWNTVGANFVTATYTNGNGCAAATPASYAVNVTNAANPTISGPATMCVNSGYFYYTTEAGMSNYAWTVSGGGSITWGQGTNQVQVIWTVPGAQSVTVNYTIGNGCAAPAPTVYPVTVNPMPGSAGTITGTAAVCGGATGVSYSCAAVTDAVTYVWTLPAGATIATGSGTNFITVDFAPDAASGNITVYGNNLCGNGAPSPAFPVTVTALPAAAGTVTGPASVCQSVSGVIYTVDPIANATSYTWTVPAGATIVSGGTTNSITVDFSSTSVSGIITVLGSNSCGDGTVSPDFNVTVNPIPEAPVITLNGFILESSAPAGNQWYFNGGPITGETGQTYEPTQTGTYWSVVTLYGCSSDSSNNIYYVMIGINDNPLTSKFSVNPNPSNGQFTVQIDGAQPGKYTLEVINNLGVRVWTSGNMDISGSYKQNVDIRPVASGIYTVILRNNNNHEVRRVLVNY